MKRTGGAETNDGREHLTSSENISSNSIRFCALVVGTNPSLIWMVCTHMSGYDVKRKSLGANEFTIAHDQGFKLMYNVPGLVETECPILPSVLIGEPVLEQESNFAEILLPEHVFVPDNELEDTELVGERKVDRKIKRGIFGVVDWINCSLGDGCLLARVEHRYNDKTAQNLVLAAAR